MPKSRGLSYRDAGYAPMKRAEDSRRLEIQIMAGISINLMTIAEIRRAKQMARAQAIIQAQMKELIEQQKFNLWKMQWEMQRWIERYTRYMEYAMRKAHTA